MTKTQIVPHHPVKSGTDLIAPDSGTLPQKEDLQEVMGSLHRSDRLETLCYAFEVALEAGEQKRGPFNLDAALAALSGGYIELQGTDPQIDAQLKLIDGAIALIRRVCESLEISPSLSAQERLETLVYAFDRAASSGHTANGFYADRAVQALRNGSLELSGSPDQVKARLHLVRAAATLIERASQYDVPFHRPPKAMHYLRSNKHKAEREAIREVALAAEERERDIYQAGVRAGHCTPDNE